MWLSNAMLRKSCSIFATSILVLITGCKANPPGKVETTIVNTAKHKIFIRNKSEKNPLQVSAATISDGKEAFSHYCAACHGLDGQNTGVPFADRMAPPVPL